MHCISQSGPCLETFLYFFTFSVRPYDKKLLKSWNIFLSGKPSDYTVRYYGHLFISAQYSALKTLEKKRKNKKMLHYVPREETHSMQSDEYFDKMENWATFVLLRVLPLFCR